jgi:hypothetical protein
MRRIVVLLVFALAAAHAVAANEAPGPKSPPAPHASGTTVHAAGLAKPLNTPPPAYSVNYEYDSLGRLITATKDTHVSSFIYDAAGNRTVSSEH